MFATQTQAKQFFADKVIAQAAKEGVPLSENECWMLRFSESDPDFKVDMTRVTALAAEIPDAEYEAKVAGLLKRACASDAASGSDGVAPYKEAYAVLKRGDHYILVMVRQGLQKWLRPWWALLW